MKDAGIPSQRQLAFKANLRPSTITRWVQEETKSIRPNDLWPVCKILDVRPEWLLLGAGPMREEGVRETTHPYSADALDAQLLGQSCETVLDALERRGGPRLPVGKLGATIAEVYLICQRDGRKPTDELVASFVRVLLA